MNITLCVDLSKMAEVLLAIKTLNDIKNNLSSVDEIRLDTIIKDTRTLRALSCENIYTIGDIKNKSIDYLMRVPNIGKTCICHIEDALEKYEMSLKRYSL
jgi:DNA-directed RNA polymerase alpha subunit